MLRFLILTLASTYFAHSAATKCFPAQSDFETRCANVNGILEGGQCFFFVDKTGTWEQAWTTCRNEGATLAQLHAFSEYTRVKEYVEKILAQCQTDCPPYASTTVALAYRDQNGLSNGQASCIAEQDSRWYYNETTPIDSLDREKSYAKYLDCTDKDMLSTGPRCYSLRFTDDDCPLGPELKYGWRPLCQITNLNQNFSKSGYCMTESEVENVSGQTADDCAYECAQRAYCRSFNFDQGRSECQLFARSILDCQEDPSKCPLNGPQTSDCVHYNYVP